MFELEKVLKSTISSIVNIIYLVDNSPLNESLDSFRNFSPKICYISNPINTGFGAVSYTHLDVYKRQTVACKLEGNHKIEF